MRSNGRIIVVALFVLVALGLGLGCLACSSGAPSVWASMQQELDERYVYCVRVQAGVNEATLVGDPAEEFSRAFLGATFDEDNREHFGPTSDIVLTFCYNDSVPIHVNQWPDDRFELWAKGEQFLVSSPELTALLRSGGFDHQQ